jgi:poly-gamma-glutamate capsule biosynthesis protein CapA/YwtB (metallophosphatase superfamily)
MTRLKATIAESSEDLEVVGKKAQKRLAKAAARAARAAERSRAQSSAGEAVPPADDTMSRCALLCQGQRWREAAILCRTAVQKALVEGKPELAASIQGALVKIECSLRRQMAAAFVVAIREWLNKEYLLDVGE